ncbi:uncharacterized protein LOC143922797 [Arctopsyche grandis]|uniref:uncharacterized protein LOC143922797 n=1 Tax=Arctopsyche grandis TaxID=121162 RepID=UPI00406D8518
MIVLAALASLIGRLFSAGNTETSVLTVALRQPVRVLLFSPHLHYNIEFRYIVFRIMSSHYYSEPSSDIEMTPERGTTDSERPTEYEMSTDDDESSTDVERVSESGTSDFEMPTEHEMTSDDDRNMFNQNFIDTSLDGCVVCRRTVSRYRHELQI